MCCLSVWMNHTNILNWPLQNIKNSIFCCYCKNVLNFPLIILFWCYSATDPPNLRAQTMTVNVENKLIWSLFHIGKHWHTSWPVHFTLYTSSAGPGEVARDNVTCYTTNNCVTSVISGKLISYTCYTNTIKINWGEIWYHIGISSHINCLTPKTKNEEAIGLRDIY